MLEIAFLTLLTPFALTQNYLADELRACRNIQNTLDRLECYDDIAFGLEELHAEPAVVDSGEDLPPSTGDWILETGAITSDSTTNVSARLLALPDLDRRAPVKLVVRCENRQTTVSVDWGLYLDSDVPSVTTRFDSHPPSDTRWSRSPNKRVSVFNPSWSKKNREQRTISFARQLVVAKKLVARVAIRGQRPVTAVFDLSDSSEALRPVREACGW
jgi:type VI secretion system protein VasI